MPAAFPYADDELPAPRRPPAGLVALPTRHHIASCLIQLGFVRSPLDRCFVYGGIRITLLDTPRLAAHFAGGLVYLSIPSLAQLEQQLTTELGYQRPPGEVGAGEVGLEPVRSARG